MLWRIYPEIIFAAKVEQRKFAPPLFNTVHIHTHAHTHAPPHSIPALGGLDCYCVWKKHQGSGQQSTLFKMARLIYLSVTVWETHCGARIKWQVQEGAISYHKLQQLLPSDSTLTLCWMVTRVRKCPLKSYSLWIAIMNPTDIWIWMMDDR